MSASSLAQELIISVLKRMNDKAEIRTIFLREYFMMKVFLQNIQIRSQIGRWKIVFDGWLANRLEARDKR
jgi:hypothetical protein